MFLTDRIFDKNIKCNLNFCILIVALLIDTETFTLRFQFLLFD